MEPVVYNLRLNAAKVGTQATINAKKGDTGTRKVSVMLSNMSAPYSLETGCTAALRATKPDGTHVFNDAAINGNAIESIVTNQMLAAAGTVHCELCLYGAVNYFYVYTVDDSGLSTGSYYFAIGEETYGFTLTSALSENDTLVYNIRTEKLTLTRSNVTTLLTVTVGSTTGTELTFSGRGDLLTSPRFDIVVEDSLYSDDAVTSSDEFGALVDATADLRQLEATVEAAEAERSGLYDKWENPSADAQSGTEPGASVELEADGVAFHFTLQQGKKGDQGDKGDTGDVHCATFELDVSTGRLAMTTPDDYEGPSFAINNNNGHMEVSINE